MGFGRHANVADAIFTAAAQGEIDVSVSAMAFYEMGLLFKTKFADLSVPVREIFQRTIHRFERYGIGEVPLKRTDTPDSMDLRTKYGLTLLDSYYAAQAKRTGMTLLSHDREYEKVREIHCKNPEQLLRELEGEMK